MEKTKLKHNKNWGRKIFTASEKLKFEKKETARIKRGMNLKPKQLNIYVKSLMSRNQRKQEIKKQIIDILSLEKNLALADIQKKLGLHRNTFNYWVEVLEKEGWIERQPIKHKGISKQGSPKTLILNKEFLKAREKDAIYNKKSFEEKHLLSIFRTELIEEIEKNPSNKQHQRLIKLFQKFGLVDVGGKLMFLLHTDYIKIDYKFSLTDKGEKLLEKLKKK